MAYLLPKIFLHDSEQNSQKRLCFEKQKDQHQTIKHLNHQLIINPSGLDLLRFIFGSVEKPSSESEQMIARAQRQTTVT